jgi:hypothetical protein
LRLHVCGRRDRSLAAEPSGRDRLRDRAKALPDVQTALNHINRISSGVSPPLPSKSLQIGRHTSASAGSHPGILLLRPGRQVVFELRNLLASVLRGTRLEALAGTAPWRPIVRSGCTGHRRMRAPAARRRGCGCPSRDLTLTRANSRSSVEVAMPKAETWARFGCASGQAVNPIITFGSSALGPVVLRAFGAPLGGPLCRHAGVAQGTLSHGFPRVGHDTERGGTARDGPNRLAKVDVEGTTLVGRGPPAVTQCRFTGAVWPVASTSKSVSNMLPTIRAVACSCGP